MKILALDQSTKCGWCAADPIAPLDSWIVGRFTAPKREETGERLIIIEDGVLALIDQHQPDLVVYEEPWMRPGAPSNAKTTNLLQMVKGAVMMAAARRSVPTEGYAPQEWRTWLKLPKKPQGAPADWIKKQTLAVVQRLGAQVAHHDEADAWGLAFYALHSKPGIKRSTADLFDRARAAL